jgi:MFS family permease
MTLIIAGFAMAFARFSDIYGRKTMVIVAWTIFTAFSLGCGLAQTMVQL